MSFFRFIALFFEGLQRNFKIIRFGDVPDVYKKPAVVERYSFASPGLKGYLRSSKELAKHLLRRRIKLYEVPSDKLIYCGGSANNEREFIFFSQLFEDHALIPGYDRKQNLSFVSAREHKKTLVEMLVSVLLLVCCLLYLFRIRLGPVSLKYLHTYSKVFLQVYASMRRQPVGTRVLVVANDHTDFPVAASMVMKYLRVPVVYVQHAEVSGAFPPLDFSVSVLRNDKSLEVYRSCGEVAGDIFIIPRREKLENVSRITQGQPEHSAVVVYLSSVFNEEAVQLCIEALQGNPAVVSVGVKPHPRASQEFLRSIRDVRIYDNIPTHDHVAVVPNSSVVIELLEAGVPVFQFFQLDEVDLDYYGFVREGIVPEILMKDLHQSFWRSGFYDGQWVSRFAAYSPAVDDSWRASVPALIARMESFLRPNS